MTEHIRWRKSSRSGASANGCVELAHSKDLVRDSKHPTGPTLAADVAGLLTAVKAGNLDR
ncbi:DUF397 domain-containing protein [Actinophytocola sp.]|uniref:DUF397 domain-containing protein n=1 Tax=Actinophytocola sp. TaxID=1872138 RepID=UPI003D6B9425